MTRGHAPRSGDHFKRVAASCFARAFTVEITSGVNVPVSVDEVRLTIDLRGRVDATPQP